MKSNQVETENTEQEQPRKLNMLQESRAAIAKLKEEAKSFDPTAPRIHYYEKEGVSRFGEQVDVFSIRSINSAIGIAQLEPDPTQLWGALWYEGEVCCLFADSNAGKSILAVQIGDYIAQNQPVLYFDFEMSDKQFQLRYTNEEGTLHTFPEKFYRSTLNRNSYRGGSITESLISSMGKFLSKTRTKVLIIDNLTYLSSSAEKGDEAAELMIQLMNLKHRYGLSILVLAHTPKRLMSSPISQNDLAGSKKLFNFFDSVFAIGKSAKDKNLRYVKQLKVRNGEYLYDSDNVITFSIEKVDSMLKFVSQGFTDERSHLEEIDNEKRAELRAKVKELADKGLSTRDIATQLGISKSTANRLLLS